uniref:PKD domain-containing protein n=1 Tax=uncultured Draconibacterium sp. TaxID=1573823 RepID=UPI003217CB69
MKKSGLLALLVLFLISGASFGQNPNKKFKMEGVNSTSIAINKIFSESVEIFPFDKNGTLIYGLDASANIELKGDNSLVRLLLIDNNFNEYLIYESYNLLLDEETSFSIENLCEETSILAGILPYSVQIEIENAKLELKSLSYTTTIEQGKNIAAIKKEKKKAQNQAKIDKINKNLKKKNKHWVAGSTSVSELSWGEKKKLYGQGTFSAGFEYYAGGIISATSTDSTTTGDGTLKSATTTSSPYIDAWDWRDRHGKNWITPITDQEICGSCWAFAATGATEAMVNLYYNKQLNIDLSEQDLLSCANAGNCGGGYPRYAIDYIVNTGIVDEATFPYAATVLPCDSKGTSPNELIRFSGKEPFGYGSEEYYTYTEDNLKKMLIKMGPVSSALNDWAHAMTLVGYKVVKEGDIFYYRDLNLSRYWITIEAGNPLIGKTVWIFKNSWGPDFGDEGYVYVETAINNITATFALKTPAISSINNYEVHCEDRDGDGYYWWGIGEKPANCPPCPDLADGDDSDATLGPLDEYGYCMPLSGTNSPVANFSASKTSITKEENITFSDLSTNTPTSWSWTFDGGTPGTSTVQNPLVTYNTAGTYKVTLTATNADGSDTKTAYNYIQVNDPIVIPVANFVANKTNITTEESISFSDLSTNATSWSWTFEGATPATSIAQNPSVTYYTAGTYKVTLTAINGAESDTKVIDNYIEVTDPIVIPVADFSSDRANIKTGESVTFSDLSTDATSRTWTFAGGTPATSTSQNPSVTYNTAGIYKVTLTATNGAYSDTKTVDNYIQVTDQVVVVVPAADFSANKTTITTEESVSFSDLSTDATSWNWNFEGGTPASSTAQNPSVTYYTAGTYKVTLTAINGAESDTKTVYNYIQVNDPVVIPAANFVAGNTTINTGETVSFSDLSTDATSWSWTFEGGTPATSTAQNPTVTYTTSGSYNVTLTATNGDQSDTKAVYNYIQVNDPVISPVADFTADNTAITEGQEVMFQDKSKNNPVAWNWIFQGGTPATSNLKNPIVKYNSANNYRVTLTVTNDAGEDTKIVDNYIQVEEYIPSYCIPTANASNEWIANVKIDAQSNSSGASGYADLTAFGFELESGVNHTIELTPDFSTRSKFEYWAVWIDLDQDMIFSDSEKLFSSSKSKSAVSGSLFIPAGLNITTRMRVMMSPTAQATACEAITGEVEDYTVRLFEPAPVADFTVSSTSVVVGETVQFTNTSLYNPTSLQWSFEGINMSASTVENPAVSYSNPGEYTVILTVSNELGSSQKSMTISVFDKNDNTAIYCTPSNISSMVNYIRNVAFAGLDVSSAGDGYQLSETTFDNIDAGQAYPIELSPWSSTTRNFWRVWIDFNQDGDFDDADETVFALNNKKGTVKGDIIIPSNASGTTQMRVAMKVGSESSACEDDFVGEVEDYTISINEALPQMQASASNPFGEIGTQSEVRVYPNPTSDYINISLEMVEPDDSYTIFNLSGAMLVQNQITSSLTQVDLSSYPSGIYLVRVNNNGQVMNKKIIKKD